MIVPILTIIVGLICLGIVVWRLVLPRYRLAQEKAKAAAGAISLYSSPFNGLYHTMNAVPLVSQRQSFHYSGKFSQCVEALGWVVENCTAYYTEFPATGARYSADHNCTMTFYLTDSDAVLFKLRWMTNDAP